MVRHNRSRVISAVLLFTVLPLLPILPILPAAAQFSQQGGKLTGTGAVGSAQQGVSVSISSVGNTAIVGGYADNGGIGATWVFRRTAGVWSQQGSRLVGAGAVGGAAFQGVSVSLSGDASTAIVGGYADNGGVGAAWIFRDSAGVWVQQGNKLVGSGAVGGAEQGISVAISGDGNTAIIGGAQDNSSEGAAWIFIRSGGVWNQQGTKLVGTGPSGAASQGVAVSISSDGNTALVGGVSDSLGIGAAWVFTRSAGVWNQQGEKLVGTEAIGESQQGFAVDLSADGNTAIIGGYADNSGAGAAWVFARSGGVWTQQGAKLTGAGGVGEFLYQGYSVALSGNGSTAVLGGYFDNSGVGAAWVFGRSAGTWSQQGSKLVGSGADGLANQGSSVSIADDGLTAIVGAFGDSSALGASWIFNRAPPTGIAVDIGLSKGWNIVSVPLVMADYTATELFPTAITLAFAYNDGYVSPETLANGPGYWMKFAANQTISHEGIAVRTADTVDVVVGWNIIGSLSVPVDLTSIGSNPGGIRTSELYGYDGNYHPVTTLLPGKGFWVLITQPGQLFLSGSGPVPVASRIRVEPMAELPPPPPEAGGAGDPGDLAEETPREIALEQNYPNPFNPVTSIRFSLPASEHVVLSVYNLLGQRVALLVDGVREEGRHTVTFDAAALPTGVYHYRMEAGGFTGTRKLLVIK